MKHFVNPLKRLDRYIIVKFIGTYIFAILLIISISIVFDFNQNMAKFANNHAPWRAIIVDYYAANRETCSESQRNYLSLIFYFMYYSHIDIVCQKLKKRFRAYRLIKKFDRGLKKTAPDLYEKVDAFPYLRYSRRLGYLNVWLFNKPFSRLIDLGRRLRAR